MSDLGIELKERWIYTYKQNGLSERPVIEPGAEAVRVGIKRTYGVEINWICSLIIYGKNQEWMEFITKEIGWNVDIINWGMNNKSCEGIGRDNIINDAFEMP